MQKYWLDKKSNSNGFMLFPRALSITWAEENRYWRWKSLEESRYIYKSLTKFILFLHLNVSQFYSTLILIGEKIKLYIRKGKLYIRKGAGNRK